MLKPFPSMGDPELASFAASLSHRTGTVLHMFKRDYIYSCYESQATLLAKLFFETPDVVRRDGPGGSLRVLNISRTILSRVIERFCCGGGGGGGSDVTDNSSSSSSNSSSNGSNDSSSFASCGGETGLCGGGSGLAVCIWEKVSGRWHPQQLALPGYLVEVDEYLGGSGSARVSAAACAAISIHPTSFDVSMSIGNVATGELLLISFRDGGDLEHLGAALGQYAPLTVFLPKVSENATPETHAANKTLEKLLKKHRIYVCFIDSSHFDVPNGQVSSVSKAILSIQSSDVLEREGNEDEDTVNNGGALGKALEVSGLGSCVSATKAFLCAVGQFETVYRNSVLSSNGNGGNRYGKVSYSIKVGRIGSVLVYDHTVSKALSIFPEGRGTKRYRESALPSWGMDGVGGEEGEEDEDNDAPMDSPDSAGFKYDSLFELLNQTQSKAGSRLLRQWLHQPSRDLTLLQARQRRVAALVSLSSIRDELRREKSLLRGFPDVEALVKKLQFSKGNLLWSMVMAYRATFRILSIAQYFETLIHRTETEPDLVPHLNLFMEILGELTAHNEGIKALTASIEALIDIDAIVQKSNNSFHDNSEFRALNWSADQKWLRIRPTFDSNLQHLYENLSATRSAIAEDWKRCSALLGGGEDASSKSAKSKTSAKAPILHLETSPIYGIHYRLTKKDASKGLGAIGGVKSGSKSTGSVIVLATLKAGVIFRSTQLDKLARQYEDLSSKYSEIQSQIVLNARDEALVHYGALSAAARAVARLDLYCTLAHVATLHDWCQPELYGDSESMRDNSDGVVALDSSSGSPLSSMGIDVVGLRHACLAPALGAKYIPSDARLGKQRISIVTGPNMGGKSTYLRALGQCVLLAQIGSFVPAERATIPLVDCLLARVGASDSLEGGVSTFMAEMLEMSQILRTCTSRSLLLIDELGRGTSTEEGFGIAYAIVEKLAKDIRPCVVLATHFHELTKIADEFDIVQNVHVDAAITTLKENDGSERQALCMLYKVVPGVCFKSFGINVARLAAFPQEVLDDAESLLSALDRSSRGDAWTSNKRVRL